MEIEEEESSGVVQVAISKKVIWFLIVLCVIAGLGLVAWKFEWYGTALAHYNKATVTLKVREGDKFVLEGAKVQIGGADYTTDHNGKVTVSSLVAGNYHITVTKDGYVDSQEDLTLHRGENDLHFVSLNKQPEKTYTVKGFIQDYVSGQPLVDVQVTLGSKTLQTDPSGAYSFEKVVPGDVTLVLSKAGYLDKTLNQKVQNADVVTAQVPLIPTGQVVFVSNRDGKRTLYVAGYDGSNQRPFLTAKTEGEDFMPLLSPNHKFVLFSSTRDKIKDTYGSDLAKLYIATIDGKQVKKVSEDVSANFNPTWSPSSQAIYFSGFSGPKIDQQTYRVYLVDKGTVLDLGEAASELVFSPDGSTVAYDTYGPDVPPNGTPTHVYSVKTLNILTGERKSLIKRPDYLSNLTFSASGLEATYEVIMDSVKHHYSVALADPNKENEIPVVVTPKRHYIPSPDKSVQAFIEQRDGKKDLFLVDKTEKNEKRLTSLGVLDDQFLPLWDDAGHYLIFAIKREAENALYIVSPNGGDPKKITDYFADNSGHP